MTSSYENCHLTFIGAGNIAKALVKSILSNNVADERKNSVKILPKQITVYSPSGRNHDYFRNLGCNTISVIERAHPNDEIINYFNFFCVKPNIARQSKFWHESMIRLLTNQYRNVSYRKIRMIMISVMAGVSCDELHDYLEEIFPEIYFPIIRIMPNTAIEINEGVVGYYSKSSDFDGKQLMVELLNKLGKAIELSNENDINTIIGISGSGIAFVYSIIQAMTDGGVSCGFSRQLSREIVAQTVLGAAKMIMETGAHPIELRDRICSPSGTTIAGIEVLEKNSLNSTLIEAVKRSAERGAELSKSVTKN